MPPRRRNNDVNINNRAPASTPSLLSTATREQVSQYAMLHSMTTGTFEDVKFYLFTRRRGGSGFVYAPRALYANSALICKASTHFDFVLSAGFSESADADMNGPFPPNRKSSTRDYDYTLDSDLEDDGEDVSETDIELDSVQSAMARLTVAVTDGGKSSGRGTSAVQVSKEPPMSPIEAPPGTEGATSPPAGDKDVALVPKDHMLPKANVDTPGSILAPVSSRKGRVVFIEDIAYRTWEAFIFYAYFDRVSFAPLTSHKGPHTPPKPFEPPPCSPKSMYRFADKYGIDRLKTLALNDLGSKMTSHNIFVELFSPFTVTYPGVQDSELGRLRDYIAEEEVLQGMPKWVQALEDGKTRMVRALQLLYRYERRPGHGRINYNTLGPSFG